MVITLYCDMAMCWQTKAKLVEPIDYESVIAKNKTLLQNDPQREMLLFPHDDVSVSELCCRLSVCLTSKHCIHIMLHNKNVNKINQSFFAFVHCLHITVLAIHNNSRVAEQFAGGGPMLLV